MLLNVFTFIAKAQSDGQRPTCQCFCTQVVLMGLCNIFYSIFTMFCAREFLISGPRD